MNLGYSNLTSTSLTLLWEPPPPLHRNGPIVNYLINLTEIPTHNSTAFWSNSTSLLLEELSIFTAYSFSVSAATSVGFGPVSEHFLFVTAEDGEYVNLCACCVSTNACLINLNVFSINYIMYLTRVSFILKFGFCGKRCNTVKPVLYSETTCIKRPLRDVPKVSAQ